MLALLSPPSTSQVFFVYAASHELVAQANHLNVWCFDMLTDEKFHLSLDVFSYLVHFDLLLLMNDDFFSCTFEVRS